MYRVIRFKKVPTYWPAMATIYVDYPSGDVEHYVTDDNGTRTLISSSSTVLPVNIKDALKAATAPSSTNRFVTYQEIQGGSAVNADWNSTSGLSEILNKPTLFSGAYNDLTGKPTLFSGAFVDLTGKPTTLNGYGITDAYPISGNPSGFQTSGQVGTAITSALSGYATQSWVGSQGYLTSVPAQTFASLTGKPTTLSGYGITDAVPYTGATANVSLGAYTLYATSIGVGISSGGSATTHVKGSSPSTGLALLVENSSPTTMFSVPNSLGSNVIFGPNTIQFGVSGSTAKTLVPYWGGATPYGLKIEDNIGSLTAVGAGYGIQLGNSYSYVMNQVAASYSIVRVNVNNFAPTSGSTLLNTFSVTGTINQTGTATGVTRGVLISQILTSAVDYRALEVVTRNNANDTLIKLNNGSIDIMCVKGDAKISFFGVSPVVQQPLGVATAGLTYTATEQAMLQKVYDLLRAFGLGT